ncbi:MAG: phosphate binding protein [Herbinix sp.]|nr:phosphate binding protein [Herbinix sp.]
MRRTIKGIAALLLMLVFVIGTFTACAGNTNSTGESTDENTSTETPDTSTETPADDTADLSGTITMAGSTSMEKIANAAAESFMAKYPDVTVTAEFTGSGAGIEAVTAGTVDIGNSSRNLKDTETSAGVVENIVAIDGIAVVLDPANKVANLTKDQLVQIYTGAVSNWSAVGGADQPIVVIGREAGSGTRSAFEELLEVEDACKYSNEINSSGGVLAKVASTAGAIGYVSLDVVDSSVVTVSLDDVAPTEENIKAGSYLLSRPFIMATKGALTEQTELVQAFLNYMLSDEGQELVKTVGLITVK